MAKPQLRYVPPAGEMTVPQRDNRIIALRDLIRTHKIHLGKIDEEVADLAVRLENRKQLRKDRRVRYAELVMEKKLLEEEAAK